jgi:hypothetical protein
MAETVLERLIAGLPKQAAAGMPPAPRAGGGVGVPRNNSVVLQPPTGAPKRQDDGFGLDDPFRFAGRQALNVLDKLQIPFAAVGSTLKEASDVVAGTPVGEAFRRVDAVTPKVVDYLLPLPVRVGKNVLAAGEAGDASMEDFRDQFNRRAGSRELGLNRILPGTEVLPESVAGFVTDIALDPLTYTPGVFAKQAVRIGTKGLPKNALEGALSNAVKSGSSRQISETLATNALQTGVNASDGVQRLIADAAIRGRGALTARGLRRAGVTADDAAKLGLRVGRPNAAIRTLQGVEDVKGAIKQTFRTTEVAKGFRRAFVSDRYGRRALLNETLNKSLPVSRRAAAVLAEVGTDRSVAMARQWAARSMRAAELRMMGTRKAKALFANMSDDEVRQVVRNVEQGVDGEAENTLRAIFKDLYDQQVDEFGVKLESFGPNYVPHQFTDEWRDLADKNDDVKRLFENILSRESYQQTRTLLAGDEFMGEVLQTGTIDEINEIALKNFNVKIFNDDARDIVPRYIMQAEDAVQKAVQIRQFQELGLGEPLARKLVARTDPASVYRARQLQDAYKAAKDQSNATLRNGTKVRYSMLKNVKGVFQARMEQYQRVIRQSEDLLKAKQKNVNDLQIKLDAATAKVDVQQAVVDGLRTQLDTAVGAERSRLRRQLYEAEAELRRSSPRLEKQIDELRKQIDRELNPRIATKKGRARKAAQAEQKMKSVAQLEAELAALNNAVRSIHQDYRFVDDLLKRGPGAQDEFVAYGFSQPGFFHGSSSEIVEFSPWGSRSAENLFGAGVYTTDTPSVAATYTRKGQGGAPNVYRVEWVGEGAPKVLDMTVPQPVVNNILNDVVNGLSEADWFDPALDALDAARAAVNNPNVSAENAYKAVRDMVASAGLPLSEADEIMNQVTEKLMDAGFDAISHRGGLRVGGAGEHNVTIFLDQGKVRIVEQGVNVPTTTDFVPTAMGDIGARLSDLSPEVAALRQSMLNANDMLDMYMVSKNQVLNEQDVAEAAYLVAAANVEWSKKLLTPKIAEIDVWLSDWEKFAGKNPASRQQFDELRTRFTAVDQMLDRQDLSPEMQAIVKLEAAAAQADLAVAKSGGHVKMFEQMIAANQKQSQEFVLDKAKQGMVQVGDDLQIPDWLFNATNIEAIKKEMPMLSAWQRKYFNLFKGYAILRPGFHVRNLYSAMFNMYLEAGPSSFAGVKRWHDFYTLATHDPENYMVEAVKKFGQGEADRLDQVWQAISATGAGGGMAEFTGRTFKRPSKNPFNENNAALAGSRRWGGWVEDHVRGAHAYDVLRRGGTMEQAMDTINRWHFNYVDVTDFDQKMKLINPFWVFFSRNMALQAQAWVKTAPKINRTFVNFERNMNYGLEEDGVVPEYFYTEGATRLPIKGLQGESVYWFSDLPAVTFPGEIGRLSDPTNARFFADLGPFLKVPAELIADRQLFSDIPIDKTRPERLPLGLGRLPGAEALSFLPGFEETGSGELVLNAEAANAVRSLIPGYGQVQRIAPVNDAKALEKFPYTATSFFGGLTFAENTPRAQQGEIYRRNIALAEQLKRLRRLQEM